MLNIQISLDPNDQDEVNAAKALLAKLSGEASEDINTEDANDKQPAEPEQPTETEEEKEAREEAEAIAELKAKKAAEKAAKAKAAEKAAKPPADEDAPADEDKAAQLRALAKKLIAKDRKAMAKILATFEAEGLSAIPPFKMDKAIALIEAALEA